MLNGRVKTLHPKIHAGILNIRQNKRHKKELKKQNIKNGYLTERYARKKYKDVFLRSNAKK